MIQTAPRPEIRKAPRNARRAAWLLAALALPSAVSAQDGIEEAKSLLLEGEVEMAIEALEAHLDESPGDAEGWSALGEALQRLWQERGGSYLAMDDSCQAWLKAAELAPFDVDILFGTANAKMLMAEYTDAASLGIRALGTARLSGSELPLGLTQLVARARIGAFRSTEHTDNEAWAKDFEATWNILREIRAIDPADTSLATIEAQFLDELGLAQQAIDSVMASLRTATSDVGLHRALIDLHTRHGIIGRLAVAYADLAAQGSNGTLAWYTGYAKRLIADQALRERRHEDALAEYESCEAWMRTASTLEPAFQQGADAVRIQSLVSKAYCRIETNDLDGAEADLRAFLRDYPEWRVTPDGLNRTAMRALSSLGGKLSARYQYGRGSDLARAVVAVAPDDGTWWNNLGFFLREYGSQVFNGEEAGVADPEAQADSIWRESWDAYEKAVELSWDDPRVVNDAALMQIYHVHDDYPRAEELLWHAIETGERKLAELEENPPESVRFPLAQAVGDAYENLGYLYYHHYDKRAESREYWVKSMESDSGDRSFMQAYLDSIDGTGEDVALRGGGAFVPAPVDELPERPVMDWEGSLEEARVLADAHAQPLLVYNRGMSLSLDILLFDAFARSETFAQGTAGGVLVLADGSRHNYVDRREDGRRLPCKTWKSVTCGEHLRAHEEFVAWYTAAQGVAPGEEQEGYWSAANEAGELERLEDVVEAVRSDTIPHLREAASPIDVDALVTHALEGSPLPLVRTRSTVAAARVEEMLFDSPDATVRRNLIDALRTDGSERSLALLDAALSQSNDPELALAVLDGWNGGDITAVEHAARWSPDARVRRAADEVLQRALPDYERRARARELVSMR